MLLNLQKRVVYLNQVLARSFDTPPGTTLISLTDTPSDYGSVGQVLKSSGGAAIWADESGNVTVTLEGDVTGPQNATVVEQIDGKTAAEVSAAVTQTNVNDVKITALQSTKEQSLGNPDVDGQVLSSTVSGVRSWVTAGGDVPDAYPLTGDVTGTTDASVVSNVGGAQASDVANAVDQVPIFQQDISALEASKEDNLGNPAENGMFLSSTDAGVRSWVKLDVPDALPVGGDLSGTTDAVTVETVGANTADEIDTAVALTATNASDILDLTSSKEADLGFPQSDGQVLSSTVDGVRSWVTSGGSVPQNYPLSGDVTGNTDDSVVEEVGGKSAQDIADAVDQAEVNAQNIATMQGGGDVQRKENFTDFDGGAPEDATYLLSGYKASGNNPDDIREWVSADLYKNSEVALTGDVTGTASANTVAMVGGKTAEEIAASVDATGNNSLLGLVDTPDSYDNNPFYVAQVNQYANSLDFTNKLTGIDLADENGTTRLALNGATVEIAGEIDLTTSSSNFMNLAKGSNYINLSTNSTKNSLEMLAPYSFQFVFNNDGQKSVGLSFGANENAFYTSTVFHRYTTFKLDVDMSNKKITNLADPVDNTDAATKQFCENLKTRSIYDLDDVNAAISGPLNDGDILSWDATENHFVIGPQGDINLTDLHDVDDVGSNLNDGDTLEYDDIDHIFKFKPKSLFSYRIDAKQGIECEAGTLPHYQAYQQINANLKIPVFQMISNNSQHKYLTASGAQHVFSIGNPDNNQHNDALYIGPNGAVALSQWQFSAGIRMFSQRISDLRAPIEDGDAVNLGYMVQYLEENAGKTPSELDFENNKVLDVGVNFLTLYNSNSQDSGLRIKYNDSAKAVDYEALKSSDHRFYSYDNNDGNPVLLAKFTRTASRFNKQVYFEKDVNLGGNKITGLPTPGGTDEPATKGYVDGLIGGEGSGGVIGEIAYTDGTTRVKATNDGVEMYGRCVIKELKVAISLNTVLQMATKKIKDCCG